MAQTSDPNVYYKPKQNIPEFQKGFQWARSNMDWIISVIPSRFNNLVEKEQYDTYNGVRDAGAWDHITKTYGIEFPAGKLKHIPLIRPNLNELYGEAKMRELNWTLLSADNDALSAKLEQISNELLTEIIDMVRSGKPVNETMRNIEKHYKEDFRTELEIGGNHVMEDFILNNKLKNTLDEALLDKFISGKQYYMVDIHRIGEDPEFTIIKPGQLFHADNNVKWVKQCDWGVHPTRMTPVEVLDKWGDKLSNADRLKLESWQEMYIKDVYKLDSPWDADRLIESPEDFQSFTNSNQNNKLSIYYVQWKSIRKITYIENENKYVPDSPFIKIIPEDKIEEVPKGRQSKLKYRYIQDLWEGVRIGDDIYVNLGKVKYPVRSSRNPSKVFLSFNGLTFNGAIKPYSLVGTTSDIQNLYDIMHWHKENLIALAGVKGSIMDIKAIPDFGTGKFADNLKMWFYYKKLGAAFIDRSKKGADKGFNQYGQYDDTMGAGLDAILATIAHLEELAGRIVGVNRQRLGSISQRDGKGTTEQAIFQVSMTTEPIFAEHDEFVQEALRDILQACRVAYKNGYTSSYLAGQMEQKIFSVQHDFALADFNLYIADATKDKQSIEEMKAFAYQKVGQGLLEIDDISPLFRKSSFKDVEQAITSNMERRRAQIQEQQQAAAQLEAQLETAKTQAEIAELQAKVEKLHSEARENIEKLAIERESLNIEKEYNQGRLALDSKRVDLEAKQLEQGGRAEEVRNN